MRTRGETVGFELTWAHNLFVEWASRFPTLDRSRQRDSKQYSLFLLDCFSLFFFFFEPLPLPKLLLFLAKVSGEIMITATASAIEGPILSALSECLGESGMQQLWPWNLVPA